LLKILWLSPGHRAGLTRQRIPRCCALDQWGLAGLGAVGLRRIPGSPCRCGSCRRWRASGHFPRIPGRGLALRPA